MVNMTVKGIFRDWLPHFSVFATSVVDQRWENLHYRDSSLVEPVGPVNLGFSPAPSMIDALPEISRAGEPT